MYSLGTNPKVDPDSEKGKDMKAKVGAFFALNNSDTGPTLSIDEVTPPTMNGTIIRFDAGMPSVNSDWISEFTTSVGEGGLISSINLSNSEATLSNGTRVTLNSDGLQQLLSIPAVKSIVDRNLITDISGKISIIGNRISVKLDGGGTKELTNASLIGVNDNTYTFATNSGLISVTLSDKMAEKLPGKAKTASKGLYLGIHEDLGEGNVALGRFYVYYTPTNIVLSEIGEDTQPILIPLSGITATSEVIMSQDGMTITNSEILNNFAKVFTPKPDFSTANKVDVGNGISIVLRSPIISDT